MDKIESLEDLLLHELRDIYHAELQLVKTLPKVAKRATSQKLKLVLEQHLEETEGHVNRLEEIFDLLGQPAKAVKCKAMAGILAEAETLLKEKAAPETLDAAIIMSAQKVEHYEISAYGSTASWAGMIGRNDIKALLGQTLTDEERADQRFGELAEAGINQRPAQREAA